jgi:glycosyltransferase involved in cell wall biosynthesis
VAMSQLNPTITFVMPTQNKQEFLIEQINTIFKFSEQYEGFCEIIILTDEAEDAKLKLAWLAIKLNKMSHPHVRTRIIRYTSRIGLTNLIETSINHALGQKIVIITKTPEMIEIAKINDLMNRNILITPYVLNIHSLQENLT